MSSSVPLVAGLVVGGVASSLAYNAGLCNNWVNLLANGSSNDMIDRFSLEDQEDLMSEKITQTARIVSSLQTAVHQLRDDSPHFYKMMQSLEKHLALLQSQVENDFERIKPTLENYAREIAAQSESIRSLAVDVKHNAEGVAAALECGKAALESGKRNAQGVKHNAEGVAAALEGQEKFQEDLEQIRQLVEEHQKKGQGEQKNESKSEETEEVTVENIQRKLEAEEGKHTEIQANLKTNETKLIEARATLYISATNLLNISTKRTSNLAPESEKLRNSWKRHTSIAEVEVAAVTIAEVVVVVVVVVVAHATQKSTSSSETLEC